MLMHLMENVNWCGNDMQILQGILEGLEHVDNRALEDRQDTLVPEVLSENGEVFVRVAARKQELIYF